MGSASLHVPVFVCDIETNDRDAGDAFALWINNLAPNNGLCFLAGFCRILGPGPQKGRTIYNTDQ